MKAEGFILLCGCLILGLAGCSCKKSDRQQKILPVEAVDNTVGLNDTLGISLHPESPVYSVRQKQIVFVLSNQSGMDIITVWIIVIRMKMKRVYGGRFRNALSFLRWNMCFSMEINSISMLICIGTYRADIVSFLMSGDTTGIIRSVYRKVKW